MQSQGAGSELHDQLDADIDDSIGARMGFDAPVRTAPYSLEYDRVEAFRARYGKIKRFQDQALALFVASLRGEVDPAWSRMVVGEMPEHLGVEYHRALTERQHRTPVFFRTDEPDHGKLSEIQCSGSGWGLAEQLHRLYVANEDVFGKPEHFPEPLSRRFSEALTRHLGQTPRIHHLVDNASRPHGIRYFIQRTRALGLQYFSYDAEAEPDACNFVRSHDFISLPYHNFFDRRMKRCEEGELYFDLPPSVLFDTKLIMTWPFASETRGHFDDDVRGLFPHTALVRPEGIELEGGDRVSLEEFAGLPRRDVDWYLKYARTDIGINWGSQAVYALGNSSRRQLRSLLTEAAADAAHGRPWIVQRASRRRERVTAVRRDGRVIEDDAYTKASGFYGPDGLMGILVMQHRFGQVHGGRDTVMSIVH